MAGRATSCSTATAKNLYGNDIRIMKDYSIKASELKSLIRSWRARGVKPIDAMRVMLLYLGAERYMDPSTGAYLPSSYNQMRKEYKYRDMATLLRVIITSGSFWVVRRKEDDLIVAFYSPQVVKTYPLGNDLYETPGPPAVSGSDFSLFKTHTKDVCIYRPSLADGHNKSFVGASLKDAPKGKEALNIGGVASDPHSEEQESNRSSKLAADAAATKLVARWEARSSRRDHKHFHRVVAPMARERLECFFDHLYIQHYDQWQRIFLPLHSALLAGGLDQTQAANAIDLYTKRRIIPHMECRKGIENWYDTQIAGWAASFMQPRYLSLRIRECLQLWQLFRPFSSAFHKNS